MHLYSIASRSPHSIRDGTTLRVKNLLENAARMPGWEVHVIAPVRGGEIPRAQEWAHGQGITFHAIQETSSSEWDTAQRRLFKDQTLRILEKAGAMTPGAGILVVAHGLQAIVDMAVPAAALWVGDLIDEPGPRMRYMAMRCLMQGKIFRSLQAFSNFLHYRNDMVPCYSRFKKIFTAAYDDARRALRLVPGISVSVVPNGVALPEEREIVPWTARKKIAMFHGVFSYEPNEDAATFLMDKISPALAARHDDWRIVIAGREPTCRMRANAGDRASVELLADVPDMGTRLAVASLGLYPVFMRTGIQNKVLEAMSFGVPVITTPGVQAVLKGFDAGAESCMRLARNAREYISVIHSLIEDPVKLESMGKAGRAYVARAFDWLRITRRFLDSSN